jgi:hypothetical protein
MAVAALLTLGRTGCASQTDDAPTEPDAGQEQATDVATSERGHQLVELGEPVTLYDGDAEVGELTIEDMAEVDTSDSAFAFDQDRTYFLVTVSASATPDLAEPLQFVWLGVDSEGYNISDGIEHSIADISDEEGFEGTISGGEKTRGVLLVSFPDEHGSIILKVSGGSTGMVAMEGSTGYELEF